MRGLAPLSYWLALGYYHWAKNRWLGRVDALHPDAAFVGERIGYYERLLGIQGKRWEELVRL